MKTRSRKATSTKKSQPEAGSAERAQLQPSVQDPPQVFVWPKETSPGARVVTLSNPATSTPNRYLLCPEKGCYEFTRIAAPKRACNSWLLAPEESDNVKKENEGYALQTPDLMVATPVDPLFLVLPALTTDNNMFLTPLDYLERQEEHSAHLKQMLRQDEAGTLEKMFERSMLSVSDTMEAGEEMLCRFSAEKLCQRLVTKAKRMVDKGLPASMEERFVKQALAVPVMTIRREKSSVSVADTTAGAESDSASTSQDTERTDASAATMSTAATSIADTPAPPAAATPEIVNLLRLRTALNFLLSSYISPTLRNTLHPLLADPSRATIDFVPLDNHLQHLAKLKQEAHALRSLSDNISRKRSTMDDEEAIEKAEAKKRKKDEEDARKKNVSQGVKKLAKADRSGMKSISSFFGAKLAGGKK